MPFSYRGIHPRAHTPIYLGCCYSVLNQNSQEACLPVSVTLEKPRKTLQSHWMELQFLLPRFLAGKVRKVSLVLTREEAAGASRGQPTTELFLLMFSLDFRRAPRQRCQRTKLPTGTVWVLKWIVVNFQPLWEGKE